LNSSLNPEAREALLDGSLLRFQCKDCGEASELVYPMLYHDMERSVMLWLVLSREETEAKSAFGLNDAFMRHYQFRFVYTWEQLVEKIRILESELDDRLVELVKLDLRQNTSRDGHPLQGDLRFTGVTAPSSGRGLLDFRLIGEEGPTFYQVRRSVLNDLRLQLGDRLPPPSTLCRTWLTIDEDFVKPLRQVG